MNRTKTHLYETECFENILSLEYSQRIKKKYNNGFSARSTVVNISMCPGLKGSVHNLMMNILNHSKNSLDSSIERTDMTNLVRRTGRPPTDASRLELRGLYFQLNILRTYFSQADVLILW